MGMSIPITASLLYDLLSCPHRVSLDLFGDQSKRDPVNPFIELLWEKGTRYEREVIAKLNLPFTDLSTHSPEERESRTIEALKRGDPLIYGGRISAGDLLGAPDLLRRQGNGYVAGDIKSGSGEEGDDDNAKLKKHYAVQLALYTDILERIGFSAGRTPFVWDIHGDEISYPLDEPQGVRDPITMWEVYQAALDQARMIVAREVSTLAAYSSKCKLCHWYSGCIRDLEKQDDLTLLPELGRAKRDVMIDSIPTLAEFCETDIGQFINGKKTVFRGIGPDSLVKFQNRARLLKKPNAQPYFRAPIALPGSAVELFFDIEVDPLRDFCYLHGFVERKNGDISTEKYIAFFADSIDAAGEEKAFRDAFQYIKNFGSRVIFHYANYEQQWWRKLQARYPTVCSLPEIDELFDKSRTVDLYLHVVKPAMEWPTRDHSIKTLASFLGFKWRDTHPSGAASIEWFDRWVNGDKSMKQRILEYNEDDCVATRVLLDGIRQL
jgi:uncharacterized protein